MARARNMMCGKNQKEGKDATAQGNEAKSLIQRGTTQWKLV